MKSLHKYKIVLFSFLFFVIASIVGTATFSTLSYASTNPLPPPPTANAGPDQTITAPTSSVSLTGAGTAGVTSYSWTKLSGSGSITSPSSPSTNITGLVPTSSAGTADTTSTSVFRLTVTDNFGQTGSDDVNIFVNPASSNGGASANAGPDQTLYYPTSSTTLSGSSSGVVGFVVYYTWTKLSGSGTIVSPSSAVTNITDLDLGTSTFRLTATNNTGTTVYDDVNIFVLRNGLPVNYPPTTESSANTQRAT